MNKLIILLKQLNIIEDVNVLLHASLKKVIVHHDNHYTFYILSKDLIPFTEYQLLLDHGLDFPYLAEFVICYDDFNFESKDVSLYRTSFTSSSNKLAAALTFVLYSFCFSISSA